MPSLVRQQKTYYVDSAGKRVPKGTPGAVQVREKQSLWYGQGIPGLPPKKRVPLSANKEVAKRMLAAMVEKSELGMHGLPSREVAVAPLEPLIVEFETSVGRKAGVKHTKVVVAHVRRVFGALGVATLADLRAKEFPSRVESYVWSATQGEGGIESTSAAYVGKHVRQFTRWLWRKKAILDFDPLASMDLPSQETQNPRRALTAEELARLVEATERSPRVFARLNGPTRAVLYLLAVATGFRAGELAVLTPENFDLDAETPLVRLKGKQTKNKKPAEQPLPVAIADRMRGYLAGRKAGQRIFQGVWLKRSAQMFRADLTAAGVPIIVDEAEAVFHSLRHSYTTLLAQFAPVKVTQELARHSDPRVTIGRYSHAGMAEKVEAVSRLPLPGTSLKAGPFADLSRQDLERVAEMLLLAVVAAEATRNVDTPRDTPRPGKGGNGGRRTETKTRIRESLGK